jgi:ABC-type proline/glycine betaine transport system permease subunit
MAREYATRRQLLADALLRHIALVVGSIGPAIVIGFPLEAARSIGGLSLHRHRALLVGAADDRGLLAVTGDDAHALI